MIGRAGARKRAIWSRYAGERLLAEAVFGERRRGASRGCARRRTPPRRCPLDRVDHLLLALGERKIVRIDSYDPTVPSARNGFRRSSIVCVARATASSTVGPSAIAIM